MMGKIYLKNLYRLLATALILLSVTSTDALAQSCVATITNPAPAGTVLAYGAARAAKPGGQARVHRGVDIMLEMCLPVQNQPGCTIMMYGGSPLWKTGGYGLYARYNCGPRVEVRYAHLNGWGAGQPINGRSGAARPTPPHIHYEVLVDRVRVDPQCVWGVHPNQSVCPPGLGNTPANMCDNSVLDRLKSNALNRYTNKPGGITSSKGVEPGIDPSGVGPGPFEEDLPGCPAQPPGVTPQPVEHEHDDVDDLEEGGDLPVIQPPVYPVIPPQVLVPLIPGVPTGDPNLAPPPEDGSSPDKISGCAADTWTAMVNQAVMETRREDMLNKRFIVKPDSVLDYSCFGQELKNVGDLAGPIFSETEKWNNVSVDLIGKTTTIRLQEKEEDNDPFFSERGYNFERTYTQSNGSSITYDLLSSISLDMAIDNLVSKASKTYLENNFNSSDGFLAGSTPVSGVDPTTCNVMGAVWQAAKCKNFDGADVFYSFEDLTTNDPREFPASMSCIQ